MFSARFTNQRIIFQNIELNLLKFVRDNHQFYLEGLLRVLQNVGLGMVLEVIRVLTLDFHVEIILGVFAPIRRMRTWKVNWASDKIDVNKMKVKSEVLLNQLSSSGQLPVLQIYIHIGQFDISLIICEGFSLRGVTVFCSCFETSAQTSTLDGS